MREELSKALAAIVQDLFEVEVRPALMRPEPRFGDYATNVALQLAGRLQQNPRIIAEALADRVKDIEQIDEVSVAGPGFLNLRVSAKELAMSLEREWTHAYGTSGGGRNKTVVVEFPSPNMAKPYSVGHLRPANQGWAMRNLMEATGWKVITDSHLGDYGTPFGKWVVGFLKYSSDEVLAEKGIYELSRVYIRITQDLKVEAEKGQTTLADQVQEWLLKLESGDEQASRYSALFNSISLSHMHAVMNRLHIRTDFELGEAFFAPKGKASVEQLINKGVAERNQDGSVIVRLEDHGIDTPILLQKSNGAALYATNDLATIEYREQQWHPDRVIYVVGAEQQFYFTQLFALAKKLGYTTELIHYWFGVIDQVGESGKREKMSSRKGVVLVEELLDAAEAKAVEVVAEREVDEEDIRRVALGAIKFTDFAQDRRTNILFDWDRMFSLTGYSGPYVQYAAVRVNQILAKSGGEVKVQEGYDWQAEKEIIAKLLDYPDVVREAAENYEPHRIARYLYDLARELNRYYEQTPVLKAEDTIRSNRLSFLRKVSQVFAHGLGVLGIEVPTKM